MSKLFQTVLKGHAVRRKRRERERGRESQTEKVFSYFHRSKKRSVRVTSGTEYTDQVHYNRLRQ